MNKKQNACDVLTVIKSICSSLNVSKKTICQLLKELANEYGIHPAEFFGTSEESLADLTKNMTEFKYHAEKMQEKALIVADLLQTGNSAGALAAPTSAIGKKKRGRPQKTDKQTESDALPKKRGRKPKNKKTDASLSETTSAEQIPTPPPQQDKTETSEPPLDDAEAFARKVESLKFGKEYQLDILYRLDGRFVLSKRVMSDAEAIGVLIPRQDKNRCQFTKFVLHKDAAPRDFSYKMAEEAAQALPEYLGHKFQVLSPIYNSSCKPFQIEIDMIMKKIGGDKLNLANAAIARYVCDVE